MRKVGATSAPIRLVASIGGFHGPNYAVHWIDNKLQYRTDESRASVVPSASDWETFWGSLDKIWVWSWQASYDDPDILDGTQWALDISDGSRSVRCTGSNRYPRSFQKFLKAVGALVGQPFGT